MKPKLALNISLAMLITGFIVLYAGSFYLWHPGISKAVFWICCGGILSMFSSVFFFAWFAYKVQL